MGRRLSFLRVLQDPLRIGPAAILGQFHGQLSRDTNLLSITYVGWPNVSDGEKEALVAAIWKSIVIEPEEAKDRALDYIVSDIGKKLRDYKTKLCTNRVTQPYKRFLKAEATKNNQDFDPKECVVPPRAYALERRPPNVPAPMWMQYVDLRLSENMVLSRLNCLRRAEYKSPHTGGSKKLRVRGSELEAVTGKRPTRGELYAITHKKKDGTYTDHNVAT
ncbi:hypothetical protein LINPERPRIM_LOCUS41112 [Linum perenne]